MTRAVAPSSKALIKEGAEQLDRFGEMPVRYDPQALVALADRTEQALIKKGVFPENSPQLYATLGRLRKAAIPPEGAEVIIEPNNLKAIRENLAGLFEASGEHRKGVGVAFDHLNKVLEKPPEGAVLAGPAAEAASLYAKGRANYAAGMRAADLEDIRRNRRPPYPEQRTLASIWDSYVLSQFQVIIIAMVTLGVIGYMFSAIIRMVGRLLMRWTA